MFAWFWLVIQLKSISYKFCTFLTPLYQSSDLQACRCTRKRCQAQFILSYRYWGGIVTVTVVLTSFARRQQLLWLLSWPLLPGDSSYCDCCPGLLYQETVAQSTPEWLVRRWMKCQCPPHHHLNQGKLNYVYGLVLKPSLEASVSILFLNQCVCFPLFWATLFLHEAV